MVRGYHEVRETWSEGITRSERRGQRLSRGERDVVRGYHKVRDVVRGYHEVRETWSEGIMRPLHERVNCYRRDYFNIWGLKD